MNACLFSLLCLTVVQADPKPEALELKLTIPAPKVKSGAAIRWEVTVVNRGKEEMTVVQPGDGSDCGWRTPIVEWIVNGKVDGAGPQEVKDRKKGDPEKPELLPACLSGNALRISRCGNINSLRPEEVVVLKPGQELKFNAYTGEPTLEPGTHKIAIRYFHIPDLQWKGLALGKHDPKAMDQIKRSQRLTLESNVLEIVVEE